jgi:hypothetical protein
MAFHLLGSSTCLVDLVSQIDRQVQVDECPVLRLD